MHERYLTSIVGHFENMECKHEYFILTSNEIRKLACDAVFNQVFQRKMPVIEMVKMAGERAGGWQKGTPNVQINPPTVFKMRSFCFADQLT